MVCYVCHVVGANERHRTYFLDVDADLRILDPSLSIIFRILDQQNIPLDVLHLVDLGVIKNACS